jgi:hypothetical protein
MISDRFFIIRMMNVLLSFVYSWTFFDLLASSLNIASMCKQRYRSSNHTWLLDVFENKTEALLFIKVERENYKLNTQTLTP